MDGVFSNQPDQRIIIMRPNWYDTLWFDLFVWAFLIYIAIRVIRTRAYYRKLNIAVSDLQLQALQSQINPHFVGNSINAIQQFFYPPDPVSASNYIELFTQLLRQTITLSEQHFNAFQEELAYDRDYLQMIKLRFGDRFNYEIIGAENIPPSTPFPSMLLQPLLENATIHGLHPGGNSHLKLHFSWTGKQLLCTITDNGIGFKAVKARMAAKPQKHISKGLDLLLKKVETFNQLYALGLDMKLEDLSDFPPEKQGTRVRIHFSPDKIQDKAKTNNFSSWFKPAIFSKNPNFS
jgi:LytS/YehU family sensor histidine kinase